MRRLRQYSTSSSAIAGFACASSCTSLRLSSKTSTSSSAVAVAERGVPVMGHVGLTPQAVNTLGGYKAQGRSKTEWPALIADATAIADAGAFSLVIEAVAEPLAAEITGRIAIPTIGIGASAACDGQVLVLDDMLGLTGRVPKFVKAYSDLAGQARDAVRAYAAEVRSRQFPGEQHVYALKTE